MSGKDSRTEEDALCHYKGLYIIADDKNTWNMTEFLGILIDNLSQNTRRSGRCIGFILLVFIYWWWSQFTIKMLICIAYIFHIFAFLHIGADWYIVLTWMLTNFSRRGWCRCFSMFWRRVLWFIYARWAEQ